MLIGNGVRLNSNPMRQMMAPLAGAMHRAESAQTGAKKNWWAQSGVNRAMGIPSGLRPPSAWLMGRIAGALAARNEATVVVTLGPLPVAAGRNLTGSSSATVTVGNASLQLVVSATGTTTLTFSGTGLLAGALSAVGSTTVTFTVPTPTLGAVISALASTALTWSASGTPRATGALVGNITPFTELSPQNLASAVWAQILESDLDAAEVMRVLLAVAAGKTGISGTTVTFRDRADTKNRVTAVMTGSTRTTITLDPS